jgi:2-polyprenyl-6-methoxyphenol hydroxylase-like FAD-dependent oxidoreductase
MSTKENVMSAALTDVLVIGAGPVGLTLASELARYGISSRIVDQDPGTKNISKALILHVRTQEVLDAMGAIAAPIALSVPLRQISLHAYGKIIGHLHSDIIDSPHPHPIILGQDRTEKLLEEHLRGFGSQVEWNTQAIAFEQNDNGVSVTLHHSDGTEEIAQAQYLVGCDGAHSIIRKQLGFSFEGGKYENEQFIQTDAKIRWTLPKGTSYLFLTREGYMMVIEMPDDLVRVFISLPDPDPTNDAPPTLQEVEDALNRLGGVTAELYDSVWLARYRTSHRRADRFREQRVFIAGDAGHIHVPLGGQGMNTGIQDAFNLAWKLAYTLKGKANPELLDSYNAERVPVAEALLTGTDKGYRIILHPNELKQNAVRLFGPFIINQQAIRSKLLHTLEEVDISYRDTSPIVEDHGGSNELVAGDRAPSAVVVRLADKATLQLFDVFRGTHWTLLLFAGQKATAEIYQQLLHIGQTVAHKYGQLVHSHLVVSDLLPPENLSPTDSILMDSEHYAHEKYGVASPSLYLIRPDWYIGFRGGISDSNHLLDYLAKNLIG